jgi:outer membrane lipoprotein carrier protein
MMGDCVVKRNSSVRFLNGGVTVWLRRFLMMHALAFALPCVAFASATEQLRQFSQSTSAARGEFSQTVAGRNGQAGRKSEGEFSFQRPGRFNWLIRKPFEQRIVADGNKLFIYDTDLAQVSIRPLGEALGATPAALLFGPQNLDTLFELRDEPAVQGIEWMSAIPRARDSQFTKIRIGFTGKWPVQMELTDAMGQQTLLVLKNWKGAETVTPDQFQFAIPAGADVIDATQPAKRGAKPAQ